MTEKRNSEGIRIIVNPVAGGGKTSAIWKDIERQIKKLGVDYSFVLTQGVGNATELAKAAEQEGFQKIFVVGGDGTLNEVINGIELSQTAVGVIPTGSGNDLSKMVGIRGIADALASLRHQKRRRIDLGKAKGRLFINNLGIGFDACVAATKKKLGILRGNLVYVFSSLKVLGSFRAYPVEITAEGYRFCDKVMSVSIGNGQFHGGCFKLTPDAVIDDGLLDACIIKELSKMKSLLSIPKAIKGTHGCLKEVNFFKAKKIFLCSQSPLWAHLDGEVLPEPVREMEIEVLPGSLELFVPPGILP
ncbi:MAG: diacylglycerol kinase family protein [Candidatus Omnitrophota bacterium]